MVNHKHITSSRNGGQGRVSSPGATVRRKPSGRPGKLDESKNAPTQRGARGPQGKPGKGPKGASRKQGQGKPFNSPEKFNKAKASRPQAGPAPKRVKPGAYYCPIDERCGGCQLLSIPYKSQLKAKHAQMTELFADLLDERTDVGFILGMEDPLHYRNKVVSPYVGIYDKKARKERVICGMYEQGTHWVIDSGECLIENQEAKRIILTIRDMMGRFGIRPYDEDADTGFLRHVQVRVGHNSGEVMVTLVTREEAFPASRSFAKALKKAHPSITTIVQNVNTRQTNVIMGDKERTVYGPGFILDSLCGLTFRISSKSFYQVNSEQTEVLYKRAIQMCQLTGTEVLMDAYCGTGTIGLVAAKGVDGAPGAARVIGVEERPDAVADAKNNARHNGIEAEFVAMDAGEFMRQLAAEGRSLDVLMMDPPRSGSTPDFLKAACALAPRRIVYISCNPQTQARDAAYLVEHGYRIAEMQPVDMFPHTPHVENILAFQRKDAD